ELGLPLDTLESLREYVTRLSDWQIEDMGNLISRGSVNLEKAVYYLSPVAKRITEMEGTKLGGFLGAVIVNWLSGVPLTTVKLKSSFEKSLEDMISIIYSRVQFLLPWGLYATHKLVEEEASKRSINAYDGGLLAIAYLVDAGVPNFEALRLVNLDFERVD